MGHARSEHGVCRRALPYLAVGNLFLEGVFKVQSVGHLLIEAWEEEPDRVTEVAASSMKTV